MSSEEPAEKASAELEEAPESSTTSSIPPPTTSWQAIFAPQYNTYYFYNPVTQETTWTNPLQQPELSPTSPQPSTSSINPLEQPQPSTSTAALPPPELPSFTARFNSRTGQFTPANARQPGHLSEHERAKRMSEFYFDVDKWEADLAKRGGRLMDDEDDAGEEGTREKKRKRPSKKDLVCCAFLTFFLWQFF